MSDSLAMYQTELVALEMIKRAPYNPRKIKASRLDALAKSIGKFGLVEPIVVNRRTMHVVGGHQRLTVLQRENIKEAPVIFVDLDDAHEKALNVALNSPELQGEFTNDLNGMLGDLLKQLDVDDSELFNSLRLDALLDTPREPKDAPPDAAINKQWQVKPGDLWVIGDHRLLCGDSTKREDVARVLGGEKPHLCVTDPPYGVNYDPEWRARAIEAGHLWQWAKPTRTGTVMNDDRADWRETWALFPGDVIYSWHPPGADSLTHAVALQESGFVIRMQIIWAKSNSPVGRGDYHVQHEPCWYAVRKGHPARRTDDRTQTTLWKIDLDRNCGGGHSTQKPLECMARPIRNHEPCDVYDPFLGSGTTLIAAANLKRRCFGIEVSPDYCAVILQRAQDALGIKGVLA